MSSAVPNEINPMTYINPPSRPSQATPIGTVPLAATASAPTTAEVSQATTTDAAGIKRRRRGRSPTILTGAGGVEEGATLGTPTLLG